MDRPTQHPTPRKIACLLGCPDENDPARLCIAYDGNGDELAPCDVRSVRDALARHGFEAHVVPRDRKRETDVVAYVQDLFADCAPSDEVVFYFSGHGWIPDREFELVLSKTESVSGHQLLRLLRRCAARNKLLILDCCFGGAIEDLTSLFPEQSRDLRLLIAASGLQRALHDPEVYGSYFSHFLCEALTNPSLWGLPSTGGLADPLGNLGSNALVTWLQERLREVAERQVLISTAIPTPLAFPRLPQGFTVLRLNLDQPLGYPEHHRHALRAAIVDSGITADTAAASYAWCAARQLGDALPEPETLTGVAAIIDALLHPRAFYLDSDALKLPLISFVAHLNRGLPDSNPLDHWLRKVLGWLYECPGLKREHINDAQRVDNATPAAATQPSRTPCLLVEVARAIPPSPGYQVSWDFIDARGETRHKTGRGAPVGHAELPAAIAAILPAALGVSRGARIELLLPAALLVDDDLIDRLERLGCWPGVQAQGSLADGHLAHERQFLLRCWERWAGTALDAERYGGWRLREHWQERGGCLDQPPARPCLDWIGPLTAACDPAAEADRRLRAPRLEQRPLALGLVTSIGADQFAPLLRTGAPILLWPRRQPPTTTETTALKKDLKTRCADHGLAALPRALHEHRCCQAHAPAAGGRSYALSLLWDTPGLLKYDQPPDNPDLMLEAWP